MNPAFPLRCTLIFCCSIASGLTPQLLANGGAFNTSAVHRSGNLVPMEKRLTTLESENLFVQVDGDDAIVEVTYLLANNGPDDSVTFGFPIDVATPETLTTPNGYDWVMSNSFRDFKVFDDDRPVPVDKVIDKPLDGSDRPPGIDPAIRLVRRWSIMTLKFNREKRKQLKVSYKVRCIALDKGFEGDTLWKYGRRTLFYTFRPAATWGDGRVGKLTVTLDTRQLRENDVAVTGISPPGGSDENGLRNWELHNVQLSKLPDLTLSYDPTELYRDRDVRRHLLPPDLIKTLQVSSFLKPEGVAKYGKESMLDRDLRTAWVEGAPGPGIGETITFEPKDAYITEMAILNGYVADESRYYENARIKKMRVEIEFKPGEEPHEKREQREITLPDRSYRTFKPRYPFSSVDWLVQQPGGDAFIDKIKLTILEVYPGRKYQDIAVTELYICGFKAK
jgi:hypothetical protein